MSVPLSRVEIGNCAGELAVDAALILSTEKSLWEITSAARDAAVWHTLFLNGRDEPTERRRAAGRERGTFVVRLSRPIAPTF